MPPTRSINHSHIIWLPNPFARQIHTVALHLLLTGAIIACQRPGFETVATRFIIRGRACLLITSAHR